MYNGDVMREETKLIAFRCPLSLLNKIDERVKKEKPKAYDVFGGGSALISGEKPKANRSYVIVKVLEKGV